MNTKKQSGYKYDISWLTLAKALWNEKWLAAGLAVSLGTAGVLVVSKLPAVYKAEALVLVDTQKIPERFVATTVTAEVQDRLTTISQEILSATRLTKIIADFNLYAEERKKHVQEEILEMMRKDIEVKVERAGGGNRPGAFRISYLGSDPMMVAQVTNRIANLYIEENLRVREVQAEGTSEFIEHQLQEAQKQLDELEGSVSRYKLQHNGELPQQENSISSALNRLQAEFSSTQDSINRAEQSKILLQNSLTSAESTEAALLRAMRPPVQQADGSNDQASVRLAAPRTLARSEQIAARLHTLRLRYSDEHPEVKDLQLEFERARAIEKSETAAETTAQAPTRPARQPRIETAENTVLVTQLNQTRERIAGLRAQIAALDREVAGRQQDRARVLRDLNTYQVRMERLPLREQEMAALTRDYEMSRANYRSLLDKKIAAQMAGDLERRQKAEKFTILDPARVPERPAKPNRPVLYAISLLASLALGIVVATGKALLPDQLLGEWELPKEVPILGRVPRIALEATVEDEPMGGVRAPAKRWRFALLSLAAIAVLGSSAFVMVRLLQA